MPSLRRGPQAAFLALVLTFSFAAGASPLQGQDSAPALSTGTRVRILPHPPAAAWITGDLLRATEDSLVLRRAAPFRDTMRIAMPQVDRLEIGRGRHRQTGKGARVGAMIGLATGFAGGLFAASDLCKGCFYDAGAAAVARSILFFGAVGTVTGTFIGWTRTEERWDPAPAPWRTAVLRRPQESVQLGLRIGW